ncbi:hypothetical protein GW17_00025112 [Ensete ventricosum]|nr:hypothetical protein GW17_00025112 [Ensete ventricosum]
MLFSLIGFDFFSFLKISAVIRRVTVRYNDHEVPYLNELEYVNGEVWANVWQVWQGLLKSGHTAIDVLNGIAWDKETNRLFGIAHWKIGFVSCNKFPLTTAPPPTRCQGDRCVINCGEGLTTVDFSGGDAATTGAIGQSEGQREKCAIVDLLSFDNENELIADGVGKVPLLVSADAIVVVHKEDGLVQKNTSVEELRKPTY